MTDFAKYHALGNDYLVVDIQQTGVAPSADNARLLCDRHRGIGADGVVFGPMGPVIPGAPVGLQIFNSDGSSCARSGNGMRAFALYVADHYLPAGTASGTAGWRLERPERASSGNVRLMLRTSAGECAVEIADKPAGVVRIGMGVPSLRERRGPGRTDRTSLQWPLDVHDRCLDVVILDNGNPHVVVPLAEVSPELAHDLGEHVASHPSFATRSNVEFMRIQSRDEVEIQVWERGAGYTLASGSGACAAATAAHALGLTNDVVTVHMPGGDVQVELSRDGSVTLTGVVTAVASGGLEPPFRHQLMRLTSDEEPVEPGRREHGQSEVLTR